MMRTEEAKRIQTAIDTLQQLVDSGQANERHVSALEALKGQQQDAGQAVAETNSRYRGFQRGATLGLSDDIAGVSSFVTGDGFEAGRNASIAKDQQARAADPSGFSMGETAGGIGAMGAGLVAGPSAIGGSLATKALTGAGIGAGMGALMGQSEYEMDGSPEGKRWDYYKWPTATGGLFGGGVYPAGRLAGHIAGGIRNMRRPAAEGFSRMPTRTLTRAVGNTEDAGIDIRQYLDGLTDEAALMDVPGDLQAKAQGLASIRGEGGTQLLKSVRDRADGAGERIQREMDTNIAPANAAFEQRRNLAVERTSKWGPEYEAALASEGATDVKGLINSLKEAQRVAGPETAPALQKFISDLEAKAENGLIDPAQLHWIRSDLSGVIDDAPSKRNFLLSSALKDMDAVLDEVPGYAAARTGYANNRAMEDAIQEGQEALRGGRATASSPEEFKARFDKLSDAQKDAFRTGLRRDVAGLMGTSRNDAAAAWGEFSKEWNAEKLRIALGAEAEPIIKRLRSEKTFSETRGKVEGGSKTAETQEARNELGPYREPETGLRPGPIVRAKRMLDTAGNSVVDSLLYRNLGNANADLGRMLSATGADRDRIVQQLLQEAALRRQPSRSVSMTDHIVKMLSAAGGAAVTSNAKK